MQIMLQIFNAPQKYIYKIYKQLLLIILSNY